MDGGLPPVLRTPFLYLLSGRVNSEDYQIISQIENLRSELAKRGNEIVPFFLDRRLLRFITHDTSADSPPVKVPVRPFTYVARISSVHPHYGTFLHLCANATQAKTILELGSCAGISGCYLATGRSCQRFITVEGSPVLAKLAESHLRQVTNNFELVNASFDEALDRILPTLRDGIDMAYIDGSKDTFSNLHYVGRLTPYLNSGSVVVLDDIHWSSDMRELWRTVSRWKGFSYTVNAGRFGVCVWSGGAVHPKTYGLFKVAGVDLYEVKQFFENTGKGLSRIGSRPGQAP